MLDRLRCFIGLHRLFKIMQLSPGSDLVGCRNCKKKWAMNHDVEAFLSWDDDLREFYRDVYGIDRP